MDRFLPPPSLRVVRASLALVATVATFGLLPSGAEAAPRTLRCEYLEAGPAGPVGNILAISGTENTLVRREGERVLVGSTMAANGPRGFEEVACAGAQATVLNLDRIVFSATALPDDDQRQFILDERTGPLAPGAGPEVAGPEIEVELRISQRERGKPNVQVLGTEGPDAMAAAPVSPDRFGVNLDAGAERTSPDADLILDAPAKRIDLRLHGEGGADVIDARDAGRRRSLRLLQLSGEDGADTLFGSDRWDLVEGDAGPDRMLGRGGNDTFLPGVGRDRVYGGSGADFVSEGNRGSAEQDKQHDFYSGGAGADYIISRVGGRDTVRCGSGFDQAYADREDDLSAGDCEDLSGTAAHPRPLAGRLASWG